MILGINGIIAGKGTPSSLLTNLYAVYKAESNANDSLGIYNGTAVGGLTYGSGKNGNAFIGNGTNAYVTMPRTTNQFDFNEFSISLWYNHQWDCVLISNYYATNTSNRYGYKLYIQAGRIRFAIYKGTTTTITNIGQASLLSVGTTYNIVVTKSLGNNMKIYVNNTLQSLTLISGSLNADPAYNALNKVFLGAELNDSGGVTSYFKGYIDEVYFWNREINTTEVTELQTKYYPF